MTASPIESDLIYTAEQLAALLELPSVDVQIRGATLFGHGSKAAVEIRLSNGEALSFDSVRDMTRPANLIAEVVACTGAIPKIRQPDAMRAVSMLRSLAEREIVLTDNDEALEWGETYLTASQPLEVNLNDQAERWCAFSALAQRDPAARASELGISLAAAGLILRDTDGTRLIRAGWFHPFVRTFDPSMGQATLAVRMARVGWTRRGSSGRIKATAPARSAVLAWNFWVVPAGWETKR
jgi:hypothetical protein